MKNLDFYNIIDSECNGIEKKYSGYIDKSKIKDEISKNSYIFLFWFLENYKVSDIENLLNSITEGQNDNSADLIFKHKNFQGEDEFYVVQSKWVTKKNC
ncbi:hypothetical protein LAT59_04275, partial [Candidatus Gracilibacteria bacterium]|nr:hypothetical protein [Candidatus Gracilibacteria bacterium]